MESSESDDEFYDLTEQDLPAMDEFDMGSLPGEELFNLDHSTHRQKKKSSCITCAKKLADHYGIKRAMLDLRWPGEICEHRHQRGLCKSCGGVSLCPHGKEKYYCKECDGKGTKLCRHGIIERACKPCKAEKKTAQAGSAEAAAGPAEAVAGPAKAVAGPAEEMMDIGGGVKKYKKYKSNSRKSSRKSSRKN